MTNEYRSKVEDALKMVLERIDKDIKKGVTHNSEIDAHNYLVDAVDNLSYSIDHADMNEQKKDSIDIAATAILYMVKFL